MIPPTPIVPPLSAAAATVATASAAASPYMEGHLFLYARNRVAFESFSTAVVSTATAAPISTHKCILLGGLSDGLWPVPYTKELLDALPNGGGSSSTDIVGTEGSGKDEAQAIDASTTNTSTSSSHCWSLIQPILSSSYTGFGHSGGLDRDVVELDELMDYLLQHRQCEKAAIIGNSTGCQIIVHYLKHGRHADKVVVAALQAPVSDRESATICHDDDHDNDEASKEERQRLHNNEQQLHLQHAQDMVERGAHEEMMPRAAFWAPITARRFVDLYAVGGVDDYFSSDYTDGQLHERLHHVGSDSSSSSNSGSDSAAATTSRKVLVAYSGGDEYVPKSVDTELLLSRLCNAMNGKYRYANASSDGGSDCNTQSTKEDQQATVDADVDKNVAVPLYLPSGNHSLSSNHGKDATVFVQAVCRLLREAAQR